MSPDLLMETAPMSTLTARLGSARLTRSVTAAAGVLWRALRLVALAATVTAGGVGVGAFVIAPLVSSNAGRSTTSATTASTPAAATVRSAAVIDLSDLLSAAGARLARGSQGLLVGLSAGRPVRALVVPGMLLLVAAGAAATLVVLRRRDAEPLALPTRTVGGGTLGVAARSAAYPTPTLVKGGGASTGRNAGRSGSRSAAKQGHKRLRVISTMAAAGSSTPDIAMQTGLSVDAVQLMLAITADERQLQPPAA